MVEEGLGEERSGRGGERRGRGGERSKGEGETMKTGSWIESYHAERPIQPAHQQPASQPATYFFFFFIL